MTGKVFSIEKIPLEVVNSRLSRGAESRPAVLTLDPGVIVWIVSIGLHHD